MLTNPRATHLEVSQGHHNTIPYVRYFSFCAIVFNVPFFRYSTSKNVTLKSGSEVTQGHWKWYHRLGVVSYYSFIETLSVKCTVFEIFDFKNAVILKTGLAVHQRHWKCHHAIERIWLNSYWRSMALSRVVSEIFNV